MNHLSTFKNEIESEVSHFFGLWSSNRPCHRSGSLNSRSILELDLETLLSLLKQSQHVPSAVGVAQLVAERVLQAGQRLDERGEAPTFVLYKKGRRVRVLYQFDDIRNAHFTLVRSIHAKSDRLLRRHEIRKPVVGRVACGRISKHDPAVYRS